MAPDRWIDAVRTLLACGFILIPGAALVGVALRPRALRPAATLALVPALGYAAVLVLGFVLALLHVLRTPVLLVVWVGVVAVVSVLGRRRIAASASALRQQVREDPWPFRIGVGALAAFVVARAFFPPVLNLGATPLRYWADGVEIADIGRFPALVLQWDRLLPPATSKIGLSSFYASMSLVLGRDAFASLAVLLAIVAGSLFVAAWALLDALGIRWLAPIGALWLTGNVRWGHQRFSQDLSRALAEDWGRLLALCAVVLAIAAIRAAIARRGPPGSETEPSRERASDARTVPIAWLAGLVLGVSAVTHLVPTAAAAGVMSVFALVTAVAERRVWAIAKTGCAVAVPAVALAAAIFVLTPGQLGFGAAAGDQAYQAIRDRYGLPSSWDPTVFLLQNRIEQAPPPTYGPAGAWEDFRHLAISGRDYRDRAGWITALPFVLAAIGLGLALILGDRSLRIGAVTFLAFGALLLGVAMAFSIRYDTLVLQRFGARRLADYWGLPFLVLGVAGVESVLRRIAGNRASDAAGAEGPPPARRNRSTPIAAGVVVATVALALVLLPAQVRQWSSSRVNDERSLGAIAWVTEHVPCDGRVLADRRTLATFEALTGHAGVLEGMGPHLRPDVLALAIDQLLAADAFFVTPTQAYLTEHGVAAVIVTTPQTDLGGWIALRKASGASDPTLDAVAYLHAVYRSADATVYAVTPFAPNPGLPDVPVQPGYRCTATGG